MNTIPLTLTESDFQFLIDCFLTQVLSAFNRKKLYNELREARIVKPDNLPLNVVCKNTRVLLWNMNKSQLFTVNISDAPGSEGLNNKISVNDPIAIALMGYPAGATTEWEIEGEVVSLKIISVNQLDGERQPVR